MQAAKDSSISIKCSSQLNVGGINHMMRSNGVAYTLGTGFLEGKRYKIILEFKKFPTSEKQLK